MLAVVGIVVVLGAVAGGFLLEGGNLSVLFQPGELLIIGGAALGSFAIASTAKLFQRSARDLWEVFTAKDVGKEHFTQILQLLYDILSIERREGMLAVEGHVNTPSQSRVFGRYPHVLSTPLLLDFICDNFKVYMLSEMEPHEFDAIMETDIAATLRNRAIMSGGVTRTADSLPGLGIVAAVLGVVLTMGKMKESPEVLGHSVGAALVGTFLGVLLCYGIVGPMAAKMELRSKQLQAQLDVVRTALLGLSMGLPPAVAVESARRAIPGDDRPSFDELEGTIRGAKK
ncbi:MAG: flagellar motor stator protein MotA [Desulfarculus sp.]|nr:flagellar motor stator protein MotA [Desulfarculus sp.]